MYYFLMAILAVFILLQFYLARQVYNFSKNRFPKIRYWQLVTLHVCIAALAIYGFIPRGTAPRFLTVFSYYYLAALAYAFLLFLLRDVVFLVIKLAKRNKDFTVFKRKSTPIVLAISLCIVAYGSFQAQNIIVRSYDIILDKYSGDDALKIAVFSDLHLGAQYGHEKLAEIVDTINQEEVDAVFIGGDLFNDDYAALDDPEAIAKEFRRINAELGVFLAWGNHDSGATFTQMQTLVEQSEIIALEDEIVSVANLFNLAGRRDSRPIMYEGIRRQALDWSAIEDVNLPLIVLDHQPSNYKEYLETDVDLLISGHTHKGQMFPGNLITKMVYDYDYGLHTVNAAGQQILISSGIGSWGPPIRVMTDSELLILNITNK